MTPERVGVKSWPYNPTAPKEKPMDRPEPLNLTVTPLTIMIFDRYGAVTIVDGDADSGDDLKDLDPVSKAAVRELLAQAGRALNKVTMSDGRTFASGGIVTNDTQYPLRLTTTTSVPCCKECEGK